MLAQSQLVVPPAPKVHDKDLPDWRILFEFNRKTVSVQPNRAFEELVVRGFRATRLAKIPISFCDREQKK